MKFTILQFAKVLKNLRRKNWRKEKKGRRDWRRIYRVSFLFIFSWTKNLFFVLEFSFLSRCWEEEDNKSSSQEWAVAGGWEMGLQGREMKVDLGWALLYMIRKGFLSWWRWGLWGRNPFQCLCRTFRSQLRTQSSKLHLVGKGGLWTSSSLLSRGVGDKGFFFSAFR